MGSDQEDALVKEEWRGKDEENPGFPCLVTFAEKIKPHLESKSSESNEIIFKNVSREHATKKKWSHTHTHLHSRAPTSSQKDRGQVLRQQPSSSESK